MLPPDFLCENIAFLCNAMFHIIITIQTIIFFNKTAYSSIISWVAFSSLLLASVPCVVGDLWGAMVFFIYSGC